MFTISLQEILFDEKRTAHPAYGDNDDDPADDDTAGQMRLDPEDAEDACLIFFISNNK